VGIAPYGGMVGMLEGGRPRRAAPTATWSVWCGAWLVRRGGSRAPALRWRGAATQGRPYGCRSITLGAGDVIAAPDQVRGNARNRPYGYHNSTQPAFRSHIAPYKATMGVTAPAPAFIRSNYLISNL